MRPKEMPEWKWAFREYVPEELPYVQIELLRQIVAQLDELNTKLAHPSQEEKP